MRQAGIYFKGEKAGLLSQQANGHFTFEYSDLWILDNTKPSISLTLPKNKKVHKSKHLFPFFFNMLPEGKNKQVVCKHLRIDKKDFFGLLLTTALYDTIGAITIMKL